MKEIKWHWPENDSLRGVFDWTNEDVEGTCNNVTPIHMENNTDVYLNSCNTAAACDGFC